MHRRSHIVQPTASRSTLAWEEAATLRRQPWRDSGGEEHEHPDAATEDVVVRQELINTSRIPPLTTAIGTKSAHTANARRIMAVKILPRRRFCPGVDRIAMAASSFKTRQDTLANMPSQRCRSTATCAESAELECANPA